MNETVFVRPGEGRRVRDPATGRPVLAEGQDMPLDTFTRRRLADGDLVRATRPAEAARADDTAARPRAASK